MRSRAQIYFRDILSSTKLVYVRRSRALNTHTQPIQRTIKVCKIICMLLKRGNGKSVENHMDSGHKICQICASENWWFFIASRKKSSTESSFGQYFLFTISLVELVFAVLLCSCISTLISSFVHSFIRSDFPCLTTLIFVFFFVLHFSLCVFYVCFGVYVLIFFSCFVVTIIFVIMTWSDKV